MKSIFRVSLLCLLLLLLVVSCVPTSEEVSDGSSQSIAAEAMARDYIAARKAYNIEQAKPFLADDVTIIENGELMSLEEVASFLRYAEAVGENWDIVSCSARSEGNTSTVSCPILLYSNISEAMGIDPVSGNTYDFVISDNKIVSTNLNLNLDFWTPNVFNKMERWIILNHTGISSMMTSRSTVGEKVPESRGLIGITLYGIGLWETRAAEYIEFLKSQ